VLVLWKNNVNITRCKYTKTQLTFTVLDMKFTYLRRKHKSFMPQINPKYDSFLRRKCIANASQTRPFCAEKAPQTHPFNVEKVHNRRAFNKQK